MNDQWSTPEIKKFESFRDRFFQNKASRQKQTKNQSNKTLLLQERQEENSDF